MTEENRKPSINREESDRRNLELVNDAFRSNRIGISERLICQSLLLGTGAVDAEKKLDHLCSAALASEAFLEQQQEKKDSKIDLELVKAIYAINQSFRSYTSRKIDKFGTMVLNIPWALKINEDNFQKYFKPWADTSRCIFYTEYAPKWLLIPGRKIYHKTYGFPKCNYELGQCKTSEYERVREEILKEWKGKICPACQKKIPNDDVEYDDIVLFKDNPLSDYFLGVTSCLTLTSARELRGCFHSWAVAIMEKIKMVCSSYVSTQTWEEVARLLNTSDQEKQSADSNP